VRDDEEHDEHDTDQPRLVRAVAEQSAELEISEHREDADEDGERWRWRE
jgi:hypothetical protein